MQRKITFLRWVKEHYCKEILEETIRQMRKEKLRNPSDWWVYIDQIEAKFYRRDSSWIENQEFNAAA